ncbi:MAG TPA: aminodeoxychorismate synthase, component I, partial [Alphaproteobacteria bacterium]|nr:aminodeoxychorismate synthase, component I [Alphaproteobacteria bacterium]
MTRLPHIREIAWREPLAAFAPFAEDDHAFLLDSALHVDRLGRYSFFGSRPFLVLRSKNGRIRIGDEEREGDPFEALREVLARYPLETREGFPPLQCGAVGFFAYDLCHHLERLRSPRLDDVVQP